MTVVERIREICRSQKIPVYKLEKDLGYGNGYLNPKKVAQIPSDRLVQMADYLHVPLEEILGHEKAPAPEVQSGSEEEEIREYLQQIKDDPSTRMMFDLVRGATLEEIKATVAFLKALREQHN